MPFFLTSEVKNLISTSSSCCYLRRSLATAEDRQVRSISDQFSDLTEVFKDFDKNVNFVEKFSDKKSAFDPGRPNFMEMMHAIEAGKYSVVYAWHVNRIARNFQDGGWFAQQLTNGKVRYLITVNGVYSGNPRDVSYLMDEFSKATTSSAEMSQGIMRANKYKRADGYIPSGKLQPWLKHKRVGNNVINVHDDYRYPILREAVEMIMGGATPMEALHYVNEERNYLTSEGKPLSPSSFYYYLSSPLSFGKIVSNTKDDSGNTITTVDDALFKPLMTKDEYEKVGVVLGNNSKRKVTIKDWAYNGEITCGECGGAVTPHERWQLKCPDCKEKFSKYDKKGKERIQCIRCGIPFKNRPDVKLYHFTWLTCGKQKQKK